MLFSFLQSFDLCVFSFMMGMNVVKIVKNNQPKIMGYFQFLSFVSSLCVFSVYTLVIAGLGILCVEWKKFQGKYTESRDIVL